MKSELLHTVWCHISCEAAGEFWHWSPSGVKGLRNFLWGDACSSFAGWRLFVCLIDIVGVLVFIHECQFPFTPKGDQFQISPAAFPQILHHTVQRTWLFNDILPTTTTVTSYTFLLTPTLPRAIKVKFPQQPYQKYYIAEYEELWFS